MKLEVLREFTVTTPEGDRVLLPGQVVSVPDDRVPALLETAVARPLRESFEILFRKHARTVGEYALTSDQLREDRPDLHAAVEEAVRQLDRAWLSEDLKAFRTALREIERLYYQALREIPEW